MFLVNLLRRPLIWMGADFEQLRIILQTKLTIDFRRGPSMYQASGKNKQTFATQLVIFVFLGLFISFGFFSINNLLLNFTIAYAIIMVMMATTLISEFTSVLFDHRDNLIILVRPVHNRTLLLSRLLHIQFYVLYIALALSAISTIITIFKYGILTALFYFIGICLSTWITLLITTLFYLLVSKVVSGERFKDIVNYVQIFLAVIVMGGYQFLPRMMEVDALKNYTMTLHGWTYLIPPAWLAAWVQLSISSGITLKIILLSLPAFIVALGGGVFVIRFLSGGFANILMQTAEGGSEPKKEIAKKAKPASGFYRFFCVSELEKTGWKFVMSVTGRDRKFKQAVYPMYGLMVVMVFAMLRPNLNDFSGWIEQLSNSKRYLMFLFFGFFATSSLTQMQYTDTPEAGWVYKALPLDSPGHILSGAVKAMLIKFFVPLYTLITLMVLFIWGIHMFPLMVLGAILTILSALLTTLIQDTPLPFTQPREMQQKGANFIKAMLGMAIMGVLVGLVFLASFLPLWSICLLSAFVLWINTFVFKAMRRTTFGLSE
jgi:ABC-2 type transport system permease protein